MIARHPFQRILSAFRDKFELTDEFTGNYSKGLKSKIIRKYRKNPTEVEVQSGYNVQFREFVRYLTDSRNDARNFDRHWRPQFMVCDVCRYKYNVIAKMETIHEDSQHILERAQVAKNISFPKNSLFKTNSSHDDVYVRYFRQLGPFLTKKLYLRYNLDFKLFGYEYPAELINESKNVAYW